MSKEELEKISSLEFLQAMLPNVPIENLKNFSELIKKQDAIKNILEDYKTSENDK